MNHSIDKHNIVLTKQVSEHALLAAIPRDGGKFESYDYQLKVNKINKLIEKLKDVVVNTYLLSFERDATPGSVVEIECDGGTGNIIKWIRWKNNWYIIDIFEG